MQRYLLLQIEEGKGGKKGKEEGKKELIVNNLRGGQGLPTHLFILQEGTEQKERKRKNKHKRKKEKDLG